MPRPPKVESYPGSGVSQAFLFGLYEGLSLLLLVSWLDPPSCWRVIKLDRLVVGSTLVFPIPRHLIEVIRYTQSGEHKTESAINKEIRSRELKIFEEVKNIPLTWDCLYLADASILPKHRRRGLAFRSFKETIENIADDHDTLKIEVFCRPNDLATTRLAEKLRKHLEAHHISVKIIS